MMRDAAKEGGAALLSVLLLVALMSVVAIGLSEVMVRSLQQAQTVDRSTRLSWQGLAAQEVVQIGVETLRNETGRALTVRTPGLNERFVSQIGTAIIDGEIIEASNCFNLNSLAPMEGAAEADPMAIAAYEFLLDAIGFSNSEVEQLRDSLLDWFDADNVTRLGGAEDRYYTQQRPAYRTASAPMTNLSELSVVSGYEPKIIEALSNLVCVRPDRVVMGLNLNTLEPEQAPLLSVIVSGETRLRVLQDVLQNRPIAGWSETEQFLELDAIMQINPARLNINLISTNSTYVQASARITDADLIKQFTALYRLSDAGPIQLVRLSGGS